MRVGACCLRKCRKLELKDLQFFIPDLKSLLVQVPAGGGDQVPGRLQVREGGGAGGPGAEDRGAGAEPPDRCGGAGAAARGGDGGAQAEDGAGVRARVREPKAAARVRGGHQGGSR